MQPEPHINPPGRVRRVHGNGQVIALIANLAGSAVAPGVFLRGEVAPNR